MILNMGRSGPREQQADPHRQMPRPAETCKVAGLINRENMSEITWPGICSTEEDLVVKMEHKVGTSRYYLAKGKSQPGQYYQAFWLALYWPSGGTLSPALSPMLPK